MKRFLLACLLTLFSVATWAYDFEVDGIYYNKISTSTVEVTYKEFEVATPTYTGDLIIPETVDYEGSTYTVTAIGYEAFDSSTFSSISMPETITSIGEYAFWKVNNLTEVVIPNSVTYMDECVFGWCKGLKNAVLGDGLKMLASWTFESCTYLETVTLGNSITTIGYYVFGQCDNLKEVTIPASVTHLYEGVFSNCISLAKVTSLNPEPPICDKNAFYNIPYSSVLYVPQNSKSQYAVADLWKDFNYIEELESDGIDHVSSQTNAEIIGNYSIDGQQISTPQKGVNIIRYADGTSRKVLMK